MWQQVIELLDRAFSDACEHVLEPGEWVHLRQFARGNETPQHRHRLAATIAAHEGPVAPAHRDAAQAPLGVIVVDGQVAIFQVARQRLPVLQRIGDRLAGFALRQHLFANRFQIFVQFLQHWPGRMLAQQV